MEILFKIFGLEFNWSSLLMFGFGIVFGFLIMLFIYLIAVLKSFNKKVRIKKTEEDDIDEIEIKWIIDDSLAEFKNKELREEVGYLTHLIDINKNLWIDISKKFYPESKHPNLEITIDEILHLGHYITERVEHLFDSRILVFFRGLTIRRIMEMKELLDKADEKIITPSEEHGVKQFFKTFLKAINIVNPVYWIRKITMDKVLGILMVKVGESVITIVGEETYKIYSKKMFTKEDDLEDTVVSLYETINEEFKKEYEKDVKE